MNYHTETVCSKNNIKFVNKFEDDLSPLVIHKNTHNYKTTIKSTTIKAVFSEDSCDEIVSEVTFVAYNHSFPLKDETLMQNVSEKFSTEIEKPRIETMSISQWSVELLKSIVQKLHKILITN